MKNILNSIWYDLQMPFSSKGRAAIVKANQQKHFGLSILIGIACLPVFVYFNEFMLNDDDQTMDFVFGVFMSGALTWLVNATREEILDRRYKRKTCDRKGIFDWRDVRFGWYGGLVAGIIVMAILQIRF